MPEANPQSELLRRTLDRAFSSTCSVLFKRDFGSLKDNEAWLKKYCAPLRSGPSVVSGSPVFYAQPYAKGSRLVALSQVPRLSALSGAPLLSAPKVSVNDLKDVDSLLRAVRELAVYSGDKVLGQSQYVIASDNVTDSHYVFQSREIMKSEYVAFSELTIGAKHAFGCSSIGYSSFCVNTTETGHASRTFESAIALDSSDVYYCYYLRNCRECLFSFSQSAKSFLIGNNPLGREAYMTRKAELVAQISDDLQRKRAITLADLVK